MLAGKRHSAAILSAAAQNKHTMTRYHRHQHAQQRRSLVMAKKARPKLVDRLTLGAAVLEPLVTVPQVLTIFEHHTAAAVSLSTWIGYEGLTIIWLWYGIVHREKMIVIYQSLFCASQAAVIVGGMLYGARW